MAERSMNRFRAVALVVLVAVTGVVLAVTLAKSSPPATSAQTGGDDPGEIVNEHGDVVAPISPEEEARQDLDRLVREYYAAENAAYLDPSTDPTTALDPYLRNPASGARVADILTFRNEGHRLDSSTAEVHSVRVTQLDLAAQPQTAGIVDCHTVTASGTDGETGKHASFSNRRQTTWTAVSMPDGSWRLRTYESSGPGSC